MPEGQIRPSGICVIRHSFVLLLRIAAFLGGMTENARFVARFVCRLVTGFAVAVPFPGLAGFPFVVGA